MDISKSNLAACFVIAIALLTSYAGQRGANAQQQPSIAQQLSQQITLPTDVNQPPKSSNQAQPPTGLAQNQSGGPYYLTTKTPYEYYLAGLTIGLGVLSMLLVCGLFWKHIAEKTDEFVKLFAFVIVSFSAIFLIVVGYTDSQVAPAYSLLGTIIGYVFGRDVAGRRRGPTENEPAGQDTKPEIESQKKPAAVAS